MTSEPSEAAKVAEKILDPCFDMFAMDVGFQCKRRVTQDATEQIQQAINASTAELRKENERLREEVRDLQDAIDNKIVSRII